MKVTITTLKTSRILKKYRIWTIFTVYKKLSQLIKLIKYTIPLNTQDVYKILCSYSKVYVGQMGHLVMLKMTEHIRHTKNHEINKLVVAKHYAMTSHEKTV